MSYCTWNCENFKSNVYVYKDISGRFITHTEDRMYFNDETEAECAKTLINLRSEGYCIPQHAIDMLLEESSNDVDVEVMGK